MRDDKKIHSTFRAWAEPHPGHEGFVGLFHAPGLETDYAVEDGRIDMSIAIYPTAELAEIAAKNSLFKVLNSARTFAAIVHRNGKPERYARLSGAEFAVLLGEVDLTPTFFAELYGTTLKRVMSWIDGVNEHGHEERVPHPAYLLLMRIKEDPSIVDKIEADTRAVTTTRRPRAELETEGFRNV